MAVLEIDGDTALVSPVRKQQRRVGVLFVCAMVAPRAGAHART